MDESMKIPFLGQSFESYSDFHKYWTDYSLQEKEVYVTRDSKKIKESASEEVRQKFMYQMVQLNCKFGCRKSSVSQGLRQHSTFKVGCDAYVKVRITKDLKALEIIALNLTHKNHSESKEFFDVIPEVRRLSSDDRESILKFLKVESNLKLVQRTIQKDYNKKVSLKDLHNLKGQLKNENDNDLSVAVNMLQKEYGAAVFIAHDKNSIFKGMFLSTARMRKYLEMWPEIVFLDGTYKLLNTGFTTMILLVQDGNGRGQVVGVALLASEEHEIMKWFLEIFKEQNESSKNIKIFMTDKDLTKRSVIRKVFPGVNLYICLFHTLKIFKKVTDSAKMKLTSQQKNDAKCLLEKLAYSSSLQEYEMHYEQFCKYCPKQLVEYFSAHWHNIKNEWTVFSMTTGNLSNRTNNRIESINNKMKQVVKKNSSLKQMLIRFFDWYESHQLENTYKNSKQFLKSQITDFDEESPENKFINELTKYASEIVLKEIKKCQEVKILHYYEDLNECTIEENPLNTITVTPSSCECSLWNSSYLPCKHIFALQKYLNQPLYDEQLYAHRWKKQNMISSNTSNLDNTTAILHKIRKKKKLTVTQKRKIVLSKLDELTNVISLSCGKEFEKRINDIELLTDAVKQNKNIRIICNDNQNRLEESLKNLSIEDNLEDSDVNNTQETCSFFENSYHNLLDVTMPIRTKIKGRPSGHLKTTPSFCTKKKCHVRKD